MSPHAPGDLGQPHLPEVRSSPPSNDPPPTGAPHFRQQQPWSLHCAGRHPQSHPGLFLPSWPTSHPSVSPTSSASSCLGPSSAWTTSPQAAFHTVVLMARSSTQIPIAVWFLTPLRRRGNSADTHLQTPCDLAHATSTSSPPTPTAPGT